MYIPETSLPPKAERGEEAGGNRGEMEDIGGVRASLIPQSTRHLEYLNDRVHKNKDKKAKQMALSLLWNVINHFIQE